MNKAVAQLGFSLARTSMASNTAVFTIQNKSYSVAANPFDKFKDLAKSLEKKPRVLLTGSLGQLGRGLAGALRSLFGQDSVVMSDIVKPPTDPSIPPYIYLDILNLPAIRETVVNYNIDTIVHFSALLSAVGENNVPLALQVNGEGVQNVLEAARLHDLKIFIPSTIGAFGPTTPRQQTPDCCIQRPRTIYGVTKVYAELLGEYYHSRFGVDFRSLRFPGIISAMKPGGGTTDYAIQIFYDALLYGKHKCYLRPDTMLPMMYDTDCTGSVIQFLLIDGKNLPQRVYNITGYSFTPEEIAAKIRDVMPNFKIDYEICPIRQKIADSWPQSLDDSNAKKDWGWKPDYNLEKTVDIMFELIARQIENEKKISC